MTTVDRPAAPPGGQGFWWRALSPVGAVFSAFVALVILVGALRATPLSDDGLAAVAAFSTSLLLLAFGILLWRALPAHERRLAVAPKGSMRRAIGVGAGVGVGVLLGAAIIVAVATAVDGGVQDRLDDAAIDVGPATWQVVLLVISLVVLAPIGEELLFRALLLRGLVRRIRFATAAVVTGVLFTASHADAYVIWPRAISLVIAGIAFAFLYRARGYPAAVSAHATLNGISAIALVASS